MYWQTGFELPYGGPVVITSHWLGLSSALHPIPTCVCVGQCVNVVCVCALFYLFFCLVHETPARVCARKRKIHAVFGRRSHRIRAGRPSRNLHVRTIRCLCGYQSICLLMCGCVCCHSVCLSHYRSVFVTRLYI